MTVLVLDGHSRAAIESLQSLGRAGVQVDIAAESQRCLAFHSRYAARKLRQPTQHSPAGFCQWLREQDRKRNYDLIVPATEASLLGLRALDEGDPLRRKAVLPPNNALDIALDKEKTRALAQSLGIPAPQSRLITAPSEIGEGRQFPLVLKPSRSKIMADGELRTLTVAIVKNETQRQEQLRQWLPLTPVLEQQYVPGKGVGVEFLFDRGKKIWHFAHERVHEYPLSGGASSYRRSITPPAPLLRDAERLLTALNWHGVAMVEFKMDARGQYWLMEINPRLWGSLALSIDAGVNFPFGLLQVARGQKPQQPECKSVYTRDLRTDVAWLKANLMADPQDSLLLTRSRAISFIELLRPLTGREHWDHFDWRDLGITARTLGFAFADQLRPLMRSIRNWRTQRRWLPHHRAVLARVAESSSGPKKILFVCYGNICRSPLAAALARQKLPQVEIESAGFYDVPGRSSPEKMIRIAGSFGLELIQHRSARVSREQLLGADLVIAMDRENVDRIRTECPEAFSRTTLLGLFGSPITLDIRDPYQADEHATGEICRHIRSAVDGLVRCLSSETLPYPQNVSTAAQSSH